MAASFQQDQRFTLEQCLNLAGNRYDERVFQKYAEYDGKISLKKMKELDAMQFDAFLTHDWGVNEDGRNNHEAVHKISTALQRRGLSIWFDEGK